MDMQRSPSVGAKVHGILIAEDNLDSLHSRQARGNQCALWVVRRHERFVRQV